jgi:hypothetical protein
VYHFYLPIFFYVEKQLTAHTAAREQQSLPRRPLVFGISAPQAHGIVQCMRHSLCAQGLSTILIMARCLHHKSASATLRNSGNSSSPGCQRFAQGSGKSTLVEQLVRLLVHTGRAAVDVSIDDFYLRFQVSMSQTPPSRW